MGTSHPPPPSWFLFPSLRLAPYAALRRRTPLANSVQLQEPGRCLKAILPRVRRHPPRACRHGVRERSRRRAPAPHRPQGNVFWIFVVMVSGFLLLWFLDFCCYVFWIFVVMFSGFLLLCFLDFFGMNFWIFLV
jgi:hypothetical protein